jgi:hypothetical protein
MGMRLRCRAHGITPIEPPEGTRLTNPLSEEQKRIKELEKEMRDHKNKAPDLKLTCLPTEVTLVKRVLPDPMAEYERITTPLRNRPLSGYDGRDDIKQWRSELQQWLQSQGPIADESDRTFRIDLTLENAGHAPSKQIDLTIVFPKEISASYYDRHLDGQRIRPLRRPEPPQFFYGHVVLPDAVSIVPKANLWFEGSHNQYRGRVSQGKFHIHISALPHRDKWPLEGFFLTLASWEHVGKIVLPVTIRTQDPPNLHEFVIPIDVTLA